jgi:hypothetical protein
MSSATVYFWWKANEPDDVTGSLVLTLGGRQETFSILGLSTLSITTIEML